MGNQTLVPSQIQSVESYFLDLKNFIQFKSSLGSTTFMKTAKVVLIDTSIDDINIDNRYINYVTSNVSGAGGSNATDVAGSLNDQLNLSMSLNQNVNQSLNTSFNTVNITNQNLRGTNQQQILIKQKLQQLREQQQQVVVKIFPKYDLSIRLDLYSKRVREIKNIIYSRYGLCTNCIPFSELVITDRAAFLFRQFVKYNLYDRLSTRPFLTQIEKKWIAFQLLCAVNEIHSLQIVHGDMKTENVLINSFLWVSLADFASYKLVYLSKNHPSADFDYYFDISRRRTCYLAPERLDSPKESQPNRQSNLSQSPSNIDNNDSAIAELMPPDPNDFKPEMDIFSLGCVIAELFMERPLFNFAQLLAYRDKKYDPSNELINEIGDKSILDMIFSMLSLDPNDRKKANEYLQEQNDKSFPSYFVYLKNYISRFINARLTADEIVVKLKNDLPILLKNFKLNLNEMSDKNDNLSNESNLAHKHEQNFNQSNLNEYENESTNDAFLILLSLLLSCVRKIKFSENKLIAVDLMQNFSKFLDDSIILDRILPYYLCLLEDQPQQTQSPIVKSHVIYALNDCLSSVYKIDLQNLNIFPELIFDCLEKLSKDESYLVRSAVAKTISNFALTSLRYLDTVFLTRRSFLNTSQNSNNTSNNNITNLSNDEQENIDNLKIKEEKDKFATYDKEYEYYQYRVTEIVMHLITDINQNSQSSNAVKEALIRSNISKLCSFFSRQKTSEFLLPHMITILNEKTDWSVRAAFFDALCPVLSCIGWESVEIVKSLLEQGLRDSEEFVIYRTLISLSKMVEIGLLDKQQICYFLTSHIAPLLCHPSLWIRHGAINFITTVCKQNTKFSPNKKDLNNSNMITQNGLNTADILCSVAPVLSKFLQREDLLNFDKEEILFNCLKKPIKRAVYDCISQDGRSDQLFSYLNQRHEIRDLNIFNNQNYLPGYIDCNDPNVQNFFEKLCKLGFIEEDEDKLLQMKDFMDKTRISRLSSSLHNADMSASNNSTTSVYNPWSNLKENFSLKDGYINIMKDKFQKCNTEFLNSRLLYFSSSDSSKLEFSNSSNQNYHNSSFNSSLQTKIDEANSGNTNDNIFNAEWKLMFGRSDPNEKGTLKHRNSFKGSPNEISNTPNVQRQRFSSFNFSSPTNLQGNIQKKYTDCTIEIEKYLDRCKFIYDEHRLRQNRVTKVKETINSSISSNLISLSSSIGKWKPRGYLVLNSNEHTKEINKLCRNSDSIYFATCSSAEQSVKIWSTENLTDGRTGLYKSIFTYDRSTSSSSTVTQQEQSSFRPSCISFYNKNSLAVLCEDFKFYVVDFNSNRTQYRLYANEKLFKSNTCKNHVFSTTDQQNNYSQFDKILFYYLNKQQKSLTTKCGPRSCYCQSNYPIDMIRIDESSPSWPFSVSSTYDYFMGNKSSSVKGLFCYSSSTGDFSSIDMRTRSKAFDIKRDLKRGYITTMITDPWYTYITMGTSTGNIEVYDFRFMVPIQSFEHRSKTSVSRLCNHPSSSNRIIASYQANNEICIWNMDSTKNQNMNKSSIQNSITSKSSSDPEFVFWGVQTVPPLCQTKMSSSYITGMVACSAGDENGTNGIICASTDMKMRYIDLNDPNRDSYVISSAFNFQQTNKTTADLSQQNPTSSQIRNDFASSITTPNISYETRQIEGNRVLLELDQQYNSGQSTSTPYSSAAFTHQSYFTHHQDGISDLIVCYNQSNNKNQPFIITSSRDGTLKIWR